MRRTSQCTGTNSPPLPAVASRRYTQPSGVTAASMSPHSMALHASMRERWMRENRKKEHTKDPGHLSREVMHGGRSDACCEGWDGMGTHCVKARAGLGV